jgi:hypothetical protein
MTLAGMTKSPVNWIEALKQTGIVAAILIPLTSGVWFAGAKVAQVTGALDGWTARLSAIEQSTGATRSAVDDLAAKSAERDAVSARLAAVVAIHSEELNATEKSIGELRAAEHDTSNQLVALMSSLLGNKKTAANQGR